MAIYSRYCGSACMQYFIMQYKRTVVESQGSCAFGEITAPDSWKSIRVDILGGSSF